MSAIFVLAMLMLLPATTTIDAMQPQQQQLSITDATAITFHPTTGLLAVARRERDQNGFVKDGVVEFFRLDSKQLVHKVATGQLYIEQLSFSPDGSWLATASIERGNQQDETGVVKIWAVSISINIKEDKKQFSIDTKKVEERRLSSGVVAFRPDSQKLAVAIGPMDGDQKVEIFDVATRQWQSALPGDGTFDGRIYALGYSKDGETLAVLTSTGRKAYAVHPEKGAAKLLSVEPAGHGGLAFSHDGKVLIFRQVERTTVQNQVTVNHRLTFWDMATDKEIRSLSGPFDYPAVSPDGKWIAAGGAELVGQGECAHYEARVRIWDARGNLKYTFDAQGLAAASAVCFSPDAKMVAALAGQQSAVRLWRLP